MSTLASMQIYNQQYMDYNLCNIFKEIPYFPRVYKTLMDKFTMISKIGLGKTMPLTQKWLQDPLECCRQGLTRFRPRTKVVIRHRVANYNLLHH
jgi:hypothetical protein